MGLEKGTGVTSYARNLSFALRDLGATISVLYGRTIAGGAEALSREVELFDVPSGSARRWRGVRSLASAGQALWTLGSSRARATEVRVGGAVDLGPIAGRLPAYDRILNSPDIFRRAQLQFRLTGRLLRVQMPDPPEIFHWTYPLPLYVAGSRNVYTILDLIPLRLPYTTLDDKRLHIKVLRAICRRADLIVTISEHSRRDIEQILGPLRCPLANTYVNARVPDDIRGISDEDLHHQLGSVFGLNPRDYYLYVGAIEPRKNLPRLIEAFLRSGSERRLVLAGPEGWLAERELELTRLPHLSGMRWDEGILRRDEKIMRLDYLGVRQLMLLMRGTRALLFPSLYEGFGLPMLEAMTLGTPVVASSGTSLAELGGDAVLRADPLDVGSIAACIRTVDAEGFDFAQASCAVRRESEQFSHEHYCERLSAAYRTIVPAFGKPS